MPSWLSPGGVAAALAVGAAVTAGAGWRGLLLLAVFFVTSSALTRGGGRRAASQVLANGGVAAAAALLSRFEPGWMLACCGALAAAAADTWSTEIGARSPSAPRLLTTGRTLSPGTSGGVPWLGTAGALAGAAVVAAAAALLRLATPAAAVWIAAGGVAGGLADSLLGATVPARFRCGRCGAIGEAARCPCGGAAAPVSGIAWLTNDAVNGVCTLVGAAVGAAPVVLRAAGLA
jgi:uncharacterized protein (TIGR00297 family)